VHTWPEHRYAAVDFYTCGDLDPAVAHPLLARGLGARAGELMLVDRGDPSGPMRTERRQWDAAGPPEGSVLAGGPGARAETLLPAPTCYFLASGAAEGPTELNAFDHALLDAGVGDTNLVRMSSILPPGLPRTGPLPLPPGALVPVAYARMSSSTPGEVIAAAIAIGLPTDPTQPGLIMEHHDAAPLSEVRRAVRAMAIAGMEHRGRAIADVIVEGAEHRVVDHGCAFASVVLWQQPGRGEGGA
jgi:arginine decarboxylase